MMGTIENFDRESLGRQLVLEELFDLSLYRVFQQRATGPLKALLDELIPIELKHHAFWQDFFGIKIERLDAVRTFKLRMIAAGCWLFGESAIYLILEAIEVHGIRKYLTIWRTYQNTPLAAAVQTILRDEFEHEDQIVSGSEQKTISPERIRNIFLGFNDGMVEFLGAVGGFFAAFQDAKLVLIASLTGAVAGALSMAVGVFASSGSEAEMQRVVLEKEAFLSGSQAPKEVPARPLGSAVLVGVSFLFGSLVPILPVFFGAKSVLISWICGGIMVVLVTAILSFISGTQVKKRILKNFAMVAAALAAAYLVGFFANYFLHQ